MKVYALVLIGAAMSALTACKDCDCEDLETGATADRTMNREGTDGNNSNGSNRNDGNDAAGNGNRNDESPSTRYGTRSSTQTGNGASGEEHLTGGVGNADAETGTLKKNATYTEPAAKKPSEPGITGTGSTRAAGTGTSSGRKIN